MRRDFPTTLLTKPLTRLVAPLCLLLVLAGCAQQEDLSLPGITRDSLWQNVQKRCLAPSDARHPDCAIVDHKRGFVLYKDAIGTSHYLVIPDHEVSGVEAHTVWQHGQPNQWAFGWDARGMVGKALGKALPDDMLGLAINARASRSQDQLHIHLDCISEAARAFVHGSAGDIGTTWSALQFQGKPVRAVLIPSPPASMDFNAFDMVRESLDLSPEAVTDRGLFVTYVVRPEGKSGFVVVDEPVDRQAGSNGHASDFLDRRCRLAGG